LLIRVTLRRAGRHAVGIAAQEVGEVEGPLPVEIASVEYLNVRRNIF